MIEAEKACYPIKRMCELLEVSRSGYYKWRESRDSAPTPARRRRAELDIKVAKFHAASDGVYGAPRILADLRADGEQVSRKTVAASLRRQGLAGICPRRFAPATTVVDLDAAVPKDLVRRRFDTGVLNRVWTSDITYLGTAWILSVVATRAVYACSSKSVNRSAGVSQPRVLRGRVLSCSATAWRSAML